MNSISLVSSSRAEWIKFRTVPSTFWGIITLLVVTVGLGSLVDLAVVHHAHDPGFLASFDPFGTSVAGVFFAQFVVGVLGSMFITSEYSSTSIRTSLAAVPRRTLLAFSKFSVMVISILVVCEIAMFTSFSIGQAMYSGTLPSLSINSPGALRAVILAGLYLTFLAAFGFAFGLIFRRTVAALIVFVVLLLVVPAVVAALPQDWAGAIHRFLPAGFDHSLGIGMMSLNQAPGEYPPLGCALILLGYVVALVTLGFVLFTRRDA